MLADAAADIGTLGDVHWGPLDWVARGNYSTRRAGATLHVLLHSRRAVLDVPHGIDAVEVHVKAGAGRRLWDRVCCASSDARLQPEAGSWKSGAIEVSAETRVELALRAARPLSAERVPRPRIRAWPLARRLIVEGRDRTRPLLTRRSAAT